MKEKDETLLTVIEGKWGDRPTSSGGYSPNPLQFFLSH